ncbi:MAG: hypothetical protein ABIR70_13315 [Bryobacteraceae bacterium]
MEYKLSKTEADALKRFTDQAESTSREITATETRLQQLRADLNAQQGAFKGGLHLIMSQQGIGAESNQKVSYNSEQGLLTVE